MNFTCSNCKWWAGRSFGSQTLYFCMVNAPKVVSDDEWPRTVWPEVRKTDWCAEHSSIRGNPDKVL